jgi:cell shape-determining protein MreC
VSVVFVLLVVVPVLLATVAALLFTPIASVRTWLAESSASFPQFFRDRTALIEELEATKASLASAGGNRFTIDALASENRELRALLGYEGEKRILAGVIGRPNVLPYDVLMLDRGSEDGIVVGAPVYIGEHTIVGIVRTVTKQSSIVELLTTPGFTTTVYIIGPNIYTTAEGIGGGQMRVGVPQGIPLNEGDLVVLPSVTSGVYGAVSHVEAEPSQPEQYGYVSTKLPIASMRLVAVGSTPVSPVSFEEAERIVSEQRSRVLEIDVPEGVLIDLGTSTASTTTATSSAGTSTTP